MKIGTKGRLFLAQVFQGILDLSILVALIIAIHGVFKGDFPHMAGGFVASIAGWLIVTLAENHQKHIVELKLKLGEELLNAKEGE